jgi:hypothetical protein
MLRCPPAHLSGETVLSKKSCIFSGEVFSGHQPSLRDTRATWVSTGKAGILRSKTITQATVLGPMPSRLLRYSL